MRHIARYCQRCRAARLHVKYPTVKVGFGLFLTLITAGIFLPVWLLLFLVDMIRPYRCERCGSRNKIEILPIPESTTKETPNPDMSPDRPAQ
jgi:hypothetical protein